MTVIGYFLNNYKNEKIINYFLLLYNDLEYGKNSLFCCNGYRHAIFTILYYESHVEELRKAFTKDKKVLKTFFCCVITFL